MRTLRSPHTRAVGVVVPIHNEEEHLVGSLRALVVAIGHLPRCIDHQVALVLDRCIDRSTQIARDWARDRNVLLIHRALGNVGAARRLGCDRLLATWPHLHPNRVWLATTDADSTVPLARGAGGRPRVRRLAVAGTGRGAGLEATCR